MGYYISAEQGKRPEGASDPYNGMKMNKSAEKMLIALIVLIN